MPGRADTGPELARAVVGGIHRVLYRRLHTHREELTDLVEPERGYTTATIADIATTASISQSTFYEHFTDKRDAFEMALAPAARS